MSRASNQQRPSECPLPEPFPVRHIASISPKPPEAQWLVEQLWAASGVGILGAIPKSLKTWLACEIALAVSGGAKALGRFAAKSHGPVLFYAAEDDQADIRVRFDGIAKVRGVTLADAPIFLLDLLELRLDHRADLVRLGRTVAATGAHLLILDPFVRVARIDENSSQEVSAVLGGLRAIQRQHDVAVLVVHHMRKSPSTHPGQQLRGSGDFAAWVDSGLYLARRGTDVVLTAEHRRAAAPPPFSFRLALDPAPHLVIVDHHAAPDAAPEDPLAAAAVELLRRSKQPLSTVALRDKLKVRKSTLLDTLRVLRDDGLVARSDDGWGLVVDDTPTQP